MLMYVSTEKQDKPIIFKMNINWVKSLKKLSTETTRNTIHIIVETIFFLSIIIYSFPNKSSLSIKSVFKQNAATPVATFTNLVYH